MGDMVIVAYRPKPGREDDLLALTRDHVPLRELPKAQDMFAQFEPIELGWQQPRSSRFPNTAARDVTRG